MQIYAWIEDIAITIKDMDGSHDVLKDLESLRLITIKDVYHKTHTRGLLRNSEPVNNNN